MVWKISMINEATTGERHAHEVMEMMATSGKTYSRETLLSDIRERFGENALFYTCSADGLSAEMLIDFLAAKGKFSGTPEAFVFAPARMCHGH